MKPTITQLLSKGEYFGRLLAIGQTFEGTGFFILYAVTGRSLSSRSRRLVHKTGGIFVEPLSEAAISDGRRELLIYPAVLFGRGVAAGNGQHTTSIAQTLAQGKSDPLDVLKRALEGWDYEPDAPTFTPRISACVTIDGRLAMSSVSKSQEGQSQRDFFPLKLFPGRGFLLATYQGLNTNPPPPFSGPPWEFFTPSSRPQDLLLEFHQALAPKKGKDDLRVATIALTFSRPDQEPDGVEIINCSS